MKNKQINVVKAEKRFQCEKSVNVFQRLFSFEKKKKKKIK